MGPGQVISNDVPMKFCSGKIPLTEKTSLDLPD